MNNTWSYLFVRMMDMQSKLFKARADILILKGQVSYYRNLARMSGGLNE